MKVLNVRNVHDALPVGLEYLRRCGVERESRNGKVIVSPCPVTTVYAKPNERVMFWPSRDANPFFHLFEGLWMLAGRNDVEYLAQFVPGMARYSDDGKTLHGAYGFRWRGWFPIEQDEDDDPSAVLNGNSFATIDQMLSIIEMLKRNPDDRRCVLTMWDPSADLGRDGKDVPCNTQAYFLINDGALDMTVCCRSNDMIMGAYGANAVHFSMLLEFMAAGIGVPVGFYHQISNNFHAYVNDDLVKVLHLADEAPDPLRASRATNPYAWFSNGVHPLVSTPINEWLQDLSMFLDEGMVVGIRDPFFRRVAQPMADAHKAFKTGTGPDKYAVALAILEDVQADDWAVAATDWVQRRYDRFLEKGQNT